MIPIHLVEWQRRDDETGLVMPWFTHPFLDRIAHMPLDDLTAIEFGAGMSTAYWRSRFKWVDSIEANTDWAQTAQEVCDQRFLSNGTIAFRQLREGVAEDLMPYISLIPPKQYDVWIVDGIFRTETLGRAIIAQPKYIFIDNLDQDQIWISDVALRMIDQYRQEVFIQADHTNHSGKPWNSRIVYVSEAYTFEVTNDFNSHRGILKMALELTSGLVVELGCGYGSTLALYRYCNKHGRKFNSFETNETWANKFPGITQHVTVYPESLPHDALVFIDSAPAEQRAELIRRYANSAIIVIHDTEPGAEHIYHMADAIAEFRYSRTFACHTFPYTTIASNYIEV